MNKINRLPNVLLVVLDTLRAQNCSCYGYDRQTTPTLNRLAEEGVRFANAITQAPWTLPAHASLFTGKFCFTHQVDGRLYHLGSHHTLLSEIARSVGHETVGISSNVWISDAFGFHRGFDHFHKTWQIFQRESESTRLIKSDNVEGTILSKALAVLHQRNLKTMINAFYGKYIANRYDDGARYVTKKAIRWLSENPDTPFFMFLNYLDPHAPYHPPKDYRHIFSPVDLGERDVERLSRLSLQSRAFHTGEISIDEETFLLLRALYDEEIKYTDSQLGQVVEYLRKQNRLDDTLLIVLSDHGENIGEHSLMAHRFSLHETVLHVPLIIRYPIVFGKSRVEKARVQLIDIMPTILDLFAQHSKMNELCLPGISLLTKIPPSRPVLAEYLSTSYTAEARSDSFDFDDSRFNRTMRAFYHNNYKLVESQVDEQHALYDLSVDHEEQHNLATTQQDRLQEMQEMLHQFLIDNDADDTDQNEILDLERNVEERLVALGYLG